MKLLIITLIRLYKNSISKFFVNIFGYGCRFQPTCSEYAIVAYEKHGVIKGSKLTFKRLARCNPFSSKHYDPVPNKLLK